MKGGPLGRLDVHMREIVRGASVTFFVRIGGGLLSFGLNVAVARLLGADGAGIFFLALSAVTIASVLGRAGLDNAVLRFVAGRASLDDWEQVKGTYRFATLFGFCTGLAGTVLLYLSSGWLAIQLFGKPELERPLQIMSFAVAPLVMVSLNAQALKAVKRIFLSQVTNGVLVPALALLGLLALAGTYGVDGAVLAYALAAVAAALLGYLFWRSATPQLRGIAHRSPARELLHSSRALLVMSALVLVMQWTATILLGRWGTTADVAVFEAARRTAFTTTLVLTAVNSIAAPKFAELFERGQIDALGATARSSARMMIMFAAPVLLLFIVAPSWVMGLFGPEFTTGGTVLLVLALGQFINVATGSVGFVLIMTGNERLARNNTVIAATVSLVLNVLLIPRLGALGAAIATAASIASLNLSAAYLVKRQLGILTIPLRLRE